MAETSAESLRESVKLLYFQGLKSPVICRQTGVKPQTLKTWIYRYHWNQVADQMVRQMTDMAAPMVVADAHNDLERLSKRVRGKAASKIESLVDGLSQVQAGKSLGKLKAQSEVLESIARTSKAVFDWGNEAGVSILAVGIPDALDVSSTSQVVSSPSLEEISHLKDEEPKQLTDKPIEKPNG